LGASRHVIVSLGEPKTNIAIGDMVSSSKNTAKFTTAMPLLGQVLVNVMICL